MNRPRLLVLELHHLGDAVMSLPFIRGAMRDHEVHVLCRPATAAVYRLLEQPPELLPWDPPWDRENGQPGATFAQMAAQLRHGGWQTAVCAWADARVALLAARAGIPQRIGFPMTRGNYYAVERPWRKRRWLAGRLMETAGAMLLGGRPLWTVPLHRRRPDQPHLDCWRQIAGAVGGAWDETAPWFPPPPAPEGVEALARAARSAGRRLLAVHAGGRLPTKRWPAERFAAALGSEAVRAVFAPVLIGAPGEPVPDLGPGIPVVPTPDLAALAGLLARSEALLGNDSLAGHLAAALGKPVVSIFGSGQPAWFAPWGNEAGVVRRDVCPHHPCIDRCPMPSVVCLEAVQVEDVVAVLNSLATAKTSA